MRSEPETADIRRWSLTYADSAAPDDRMDMGIARKSGVAAKVPWPWLGLGLAVIALLIAGRLLPLQTWLAAFNQWVAGLGAAGIMVFILAFAAATVIFVPGSVLTIGAGFIFGLLWGTVAVSAGSTLGAVLSFLVARHLARERIFSLAQNNAKFAAIDQAVGRQGWKMILLLRLSPLTPFTLSNYLYGLTAVPLRPYVLATLVGMLPSNLLYVYLGVAGRAGLEATGQGGGPDWLRLALLGAGFVATAIVTWFISRIARRALSASAVANDQHSAGP